MSELPDGPLTGTRVVSFGQALAGSECPALLADLGAEVVKVESLTRALNVRLRSRRDHPPVYEPSGVEATSGVGVTARGQLAISLDMRNPAGLAVAHRLIGKADVLIENFSVGVMDRWGLSNRELELRYPQLVSLSMPGYGSSGPYRDYVAFGGNMSSYIGTTAMWGISDATQNDYVAAVHGALAVVAGLAYRDKANKGIHIELPQVEAGAALLGPYYLDAAANHRDLPPRAELVGGGYYLDVFPCAGPDSWLVIDVRDAGQWSALAQVIAEPALTEDPRFLTAEARWANRSDLNALISRWTAERTSYQAMTALQSVGVCAGVAQDGEQLYHDPQLWSRGHVVEVEHPDLGMYRYSQSALKMSKTPGLYRGRQPRAGEHTREVLTRWLGIDDAEVDALEREGAFA
jgi:benzylsuccinate CoA-transferase BbsF subunit